jgi:hypothetical protein
MKKSFLLLLFIFCCHTLFAQQNTFEKIIDTLGCVFASCIQETFDGGYVFGGTSNYGGNDVIIVKLDSIGTVEWAKIYSGPSIEGATYIEQMPDSGYMVNALYDGGSLNAKSWLLRLDANGDTLFTRTFSAGTGTGSTLVSAANSMASINNAIYGMTGYFRPNPVTYLSPFFIASIANGVQFANKIYSTSTIYGAESRAINKTFDNGFIMAGGIGTSFSGGDVYLIRINAYGDTLWTRTYDHSQVDAGQAVQQTADSGFIVAGYTYNLNAAHENIFLIKTDINGDTLWTKEMYNTVSNNPNSIQQTTDGGYIICGIKPTSFASFYVLKTDAYGDTIWTKQFGDSLYINWGLNGRQTKDGGYIVSGIGAIGNRNGAYIIKLDSLGNVFTGLPAPEVNNPFDFSVYPNPSSGQFNVRAKGLPGGSAWLEVYNITNQCIYFCEIKNNVPEHLDFSKTANGLYMVMLKTNNTIYSNKILIQK